MRVAFRIGAFVCFCLLLLGGVVYALQQPFARVHGVTFTVDGTLDEDQLASVAEVALKGRHFGLLPRDSILLPQVDRVEQVLRDAFPRIAHTSVERGGGHALRVIVTERTPDALWCGDVVPPSIGERDAVRGDDVRWGTCYLVDATGYLYDRAPSYSDDSFLRLYGSLTHAQPIGQFVVPTEEYRAWKDFCLEAKDSVGSISALLFVDERDVELYRADGARIILPRTESSARLLERLHALYASDTIQTEKVVEYIDLRFGTKVFIKYRESTPAEPASQPALIHSTTTE